MLDPIYSIQNVRPISHLYYTWTGWPYRGEKFPQAPNPPFFDQLDKAWEKDNCSRVSTLWAEDRIQFGFSVAPIVSPVEFVSRIKGRLQHAMRSHGDTIRLSRKVAFRAIGKNQTNEVANYVSKQVDKQPFVDVKFTQMLKGFTTVNSTKLLQEPSRSNSGRYWYNLHLVLVVAGRGRLGHEADFAKLDRIVAATADKYQHDLAVRAWMPDHLHVALRGNINQSPADIALAIMNNTSYAVGQDAIWQYGFYTGSFSEYDLGGLKSRRD